MKIDPLVCVCGTYTMQQYFHKINEHVTKYGHVLH